MELLWVVESPNMSCYLYQWKAQSKLYKVKIVGQGINEQKKKKVINMINRL